MSIKWFACVNPEPGDDHKKGGHTIFGCVSRRSSSGQIPASSGDDLASPSNNETDLLQQQGNGRSNSKALSPNNEPEDTDIKKKHRRGRRPSADERREAANRNRAIERELRETQRHESKFTHLLILGAAVIFTLL